MRTRMRKILVLMLAASLVLPPALLAQDRGGYTDEEDPSAAAMAVDAIFLRPLGLIGTVLGAGIFVVSLPFSALGGNVEEAADTLIGDPARVTFQRPLGDFDYNY